LSPSFRVDLLGCAAIACAALAFAQPPAITPRGIVNAASRMPLSLAGGKLAPGARIVIPGLRLQDAHSLTTIRLEQGPWGATLKPTSISAEQLEAVLPSDVPLGTVRVSLVNGQGSSRAEQVEVVRSNPGIFTLNGAGWGPVAGAAYNPGARVKLRVTGLNGQRPLILVGGKAARVVSFSGEDLVFEVPRGSPEGCWTPVWVQSESGTLSNFVTLSIRRARMACQQFPGWPGRTLESGKRTGVVALERVRASLEFAPGNPTNYSVAAATAIFLQAGASSAPTYTQALPPSGACTVYTGTVSLAPPQQSALPLNDGSRNGGLDSVFGRVERLLNVGSSLRLDGPAGWSAALAAQPTAGLFAGLLETGRQGRSSASPLAPGGYHLRTSGSNGVEGLDASVAVPPPFEWVNAAAVQEVDRGKGVELVWRGPPGRRMLAVVASLDAVTSALGVAVCAARPEADRMEIPPYALANIPPTASPAGLIPLRLVALISIPGTALGSGRSGGLDDLRTAFIEAEAKTAHFR